MESSDPGETAFGRCLRHRRELAGLPPHPRSGSRGLRTRADPARGGTDPDGFRTIDVWASERAWQAYRPRLDHVFDDLAEPPVVRELHIGHLSSDLVGPVTPDVAA
ncbi:MAG: hypothetical protein M3313_07775 [Actinomycetota bacterium]|nr:hypothetical protein [Actinomycetota bacterium]